MNDVKGRGKAGAAGARWGVICLGALLLVLLAWIAWTLQPGSAHRTASDPLDSAGALPEQPKMGLSPIEGEASQEAEAVHEERGPAPLVELFERATAVLSVVSSDLEVLPRAQVSISKGRGWIASAGWGRAGLLTVPAQESVTLVASEEGWGSVTREVSYEEVLGGEVVLVLNPESVRWGRLRDAEGEACAGERIQMFFLERGDRVSSTTDMSGRFPYPEVAGRLKVDERHGPIRSYAWLGYGSPMRTGQRYEDLLHLVSEDPLELQAVKRAGVLFQVNPPPFDEALRLDVFVDLEGGEPRIEQAFRASDGMFCPIAEPGVYRFRVGSQGYASAWVSAEVGARQTAGPLPVVLEEFPSLRGRITTEAGLPIEGAWIATDRWAGRLNQPPDQPSGWPLQEKAYDRRKPVGEAPKGYGVIQSEADGSFVLPFQFGVVIVHHPGYESVRYDEISSVPEEIVLREGTTVEGRAEFFDREALAWPVVVSIRARDIAPAFSPVVEQITEITEDGSFRFTAVRTGKSVLIARDAENRILAREDVEVAPGSNSVTIELRLPYEIEVVLPRSGEELTRVSLSKGSDGRFSALGVRSGADSWASSVDWIGETEVFVTQKGRARRKAGSIILDPRITTYSLNLGATVLFHTRISGITDSLNLWVEPADGSGFPVLTTPIGANDLRDARLVAPGRYVAIVQREASFWWMTVSYQVFDVPPGEDLLLHVTLEGPPSRMIQCRVVDSSGVPLAKMRVNTWHGRRRIDGGFTDGRGNVELPVPDVRPFGLDAHSPQQTMWAPFVEIAEDTTSVTFVVVPCIAVRLSTRMPGGKAASGPMTIRFLDGEDHGFNGEIELIPRGQGIPWQWQGWLPPGRWECRLPSGERGLLEVDPEDKYLKELRHSIVRFER